VRDEWVNRNVDLVPAAQGPTGMLLIDVNGETGWLPVGLKTLGSLYRSVGGDLGDLAGGGATVALKRPVPLHTLLDLEPATYLALQEALGNVGDGQLGGLFSFVGNALKSVVNAVKKVASQAASAAKSAASAAQNAGKYVVGGAMIVGGVAAGLTGVGLPVAGALVGAGVGTMTKSGSSLGKFKQWAVPAAVGGVAGAALGFGAQWVMDGGLTQVGSSVFSSSSGAQVGTVGAATPAATAETAAATGGTVAGGGAVSSPLWAALPAGAILKTASGYIMKQASGSPAPFTPAPGAAPTDAGMLALPDSTTAAPAASSQLVAGIDNSALLIAGIATAAVLVLGLRR